MDAERTLQHLDRNYIASNDDLVQPHSRPIPSIFPRYPCGVSDTYAPIPRDDVLENINLTPQIGPQLDGQPQVPYFAAIVQPVGVAVASSNQPPQRRILYAEQPVAYLNQVYYQGVQQPTSPNHHTLRYLPLRDVATSTDPPRSPPFAWDTRWCRPYDLLLQPEAVRVFNKYKNEPTSKDKKPGDKQEHAKSKHAAKPNGTVHIGGILTLPKNAPTYNEDLSQNSTASSMKDDELESDFTQPGIILFRKLAQAGIKNLKKTIVKYGVNSPKDDLKSLCDEVRSDLRSPPSGPLQIEPAVREIILAYLGICSSWSNLANVLPMAREQSHPLEDSLSSLVKEFLNWQEVSTTMLQRILDTLDVLPSEHERYISSLARSCEPRTEPGEDGDNLAIGHSANYFPVNSCSTPLQVTASYSPLPGYVYQSYPGYDIQLTVPRVELSPDLQLDDPVWAHLYPKMDSE